MYPEPRHLAPWAPRTTWDGWFAIGLFPPDNDIRWVKTHFYRYVGPDRCHPFSEIEGFGTNSEMLIAWGTAGGTVAAHRAVDPADFLSSQAPLRVELPGRFELSGAAPHYELSSTIPEDSVSVHFAVETGWPIWWAKAGRFLHYLGQHSAMRVKLAGDGVDATLEGTGTLEHVCGRGLPISTAKLVPGHWHWDVLTFHTPGAPVDSAAGLSMGRGGVTRWGKAFARFPGYGAATMQGLKVEYLELASALDPSGQTVAVPVKWTGAMKNRQGEFHYTATASTPMAPLVPGGGFVGFDFEGKWIESAGTTKHLAGTGFTEYGDRRGQLLGRVR